MFLAASTVQTSSNHVVAVAKVTLGSSFTPTDTLLTVRDFAAKAAWLGKHLLKNLANWIPVSACIMLGKRRNN